MSDYQPVKYFNTKLKNISFGIKESIFFATILNWSAISLLFSNFLLSFKSKNISHIWSLLFLITSGLFLSLSTVIYNSLEFRFLLATSIVFFITCYDCYRNQFYDNLLIHITNSGYIGLAFYFVLMKYNPEEFPNIWKDVIPSAPQTFDILILCLVFQNVGYYIVWNLLFANLNLDKWSVSSKNLINLSFIQNSYHQNILFIALCVLGSITRLWNFSQGSIYYTQGSAIPSSVGSLLAQFDRLYVVAWLYGYTFLLQTGLKKNAVSYLTSILIIVELIYQLFSGSKGRFFSFVIKPVATIFIFRRLRVSWIAVIILLALGIFSWLLLYPTLVIYRDLLKTSTSLNSVELLAQSFQILKNYSWDKYIETILIPLNESGITEQVIAMTSIVHYQVSQESSWFWQRLFLFWVPRFLWSDKPESLDINLIGRLTHRISSEDFQTSVLITAPGEIFLYYGFWGCALMIIPGLLFRWLNDAISPFKVYTFFRLAVMVAYLPLIQDSVGGTFEAGLTGIVMQIGVLYLILLLVKITLQKNWV